MKDTEGIQLTAALLEALGMDLRDPNFIDTPKRVWQSLHYLTHGEAELNALLADPRTFPCTHKELVVVSNIDAAGVCPHHILPVHLKIDFAYLPRETAIGLSKIPRIIRAACRKPVLQEELTCFIADTFFTMLNSDGVMVRITGMHDCMRVRGVALPEATTTTSAVRGMFLHNMALRSEALSNFDRKAGF
jgi:GTP cyclohydrolase I